MKEKTELSGSVFRYSIGNLFVRALSFILLPFYSNIISAEDFGVYAIVMSFYTVASVFFQFGLHSSFSKFYIEEKDAFEKKKIFNSVINFISIISFIFSISIMLMSGEISKLLFGNFNQYYLIIIIAFALLFDTISYYLLHLLKTIEKSRTVLIYSSISALINFILNIVLLYVFNLGISGIILAQAGASLILVIMLIPLITSEYSFAITKKYLRRLIIFAIPIFAAGIFSSLIDVSDRFILNHFMDERDVGVYSFSYRIALIMNVFVISFRTAWVPRAMNLYVQKEYTSTAGSTLTKIIAASGLIFISICLLAQDLFNLQIFGFNFLNKNYLDGIIILPYVLTGYFFSLIGNFYFLYPYVEEKNYHFLLGDAFSFIVNLGMNFLLIPYLGIKGAGIATMLSFMFYAFYMYIISHKKIKVKHNPGLNISIILTTAIIYFIGIYVNNVFIDILLLMTYSVIMLKNFKINFKNLFGLS
ncbi:MAG TPA: oligosaccharide flippase family protein [Ignavibacteriaceae bacterium]|nr:oligosaccharide flippase family protein [Ignavibacteriaceae bacterium]